MNLTEGQLLFRLQDFHGAEQEALGIGDHEFAQESSDIASALRELLQARRTIEELTAVVGQRNGECVRLHSLLETAEKRIAEMQALASGVKQFSEFQICHYGATEDYAKGYIDCQNNYNKVLFSAAGKGVQS